MEDYPPRRLLRWVWKVGTVKPPRDRTVVHVRDLSEQPVCPLVMVIGGALRNYVSVDHVVIADGAVRGIRTCRTPGLQEGEPVVVTMCPVHGSWGVMHRDILDMPTVAESLKAQLDDGAAMIQLAEELGVPSVDEAVPAADVAEYTGAGAHTYL